MKLPKTGDTNNNLLVFIGFILLVGGVYIILNHFQDSCIIGLSY
ncbi:LPXTG cell wall anchor domain-containing protein [Listeria monocytogenes]|nr:LPXTG cell wall anchor domain-containing protein [Listeria monocytogenes]EAC8462104.1 LPXTG cell wall anchor domain-containing protein [Listeria monocytogenes]EME1036303.1 LPXTG cell wall anchor domain-containing protein [Listeria monocytogenes]